MADPSKLLYIVVVDDDDDDGERESSSSSSTFRFTRSVLQSTLQLMGCKARHAFKVSRRVFDAMRSESSAAELSSLRGTMLSSGALGKLSDSESGDEVSHQSTEEGIGAIRSMPFELYKRLTTVVVARETFLNVVCDALSAYKYVSPNQRADLVLACRIRERKESVTVLLCGTSGCGKSTLSALLGSRLGITTVISTDSIRHMMRSFVDERQNPLLWASTYHAGEYLDPIAVAEAKAKRKAQKLDGTSRSSLKDKSLDDASDEKSDSRSPDVGLGTEMIGKKQIAIEGFKAQSEMVIESLDRLITAWEERRESVVVEGVHLSLNFVMGLMKKHPSIIPFMIYIQNEGKHLERFAVRAKYMTLDPAKNNVAAIHATVFSCLRRRQAGELIYDPTTNTVSVIYEEYRNQCAANSLSSKGMFQLIQRQGSSRHLMALVNIDGSVSKAWPVKSVDDNGKTSCRAMESCAGGPMYGPLQIGKAEPVNLQFGNFGISAWPSDIGGTSHNGSVDDSWVDGNDNGSRYFSSSCSSPWISEGTTKEPMEELSVSGSEEEADDPPGIDSDEDPSDVEEEIHEEVEGSVDEESTKSDEEYEDLAMRDILDNSYLSADANGPANIKKPTPEKPN